MTEPQPQVEESEDFRRGFIDGVRKANLKNVAVRARDRVRMDYLWVILIALSLLMKLLLWDESQFLVAIIIFWSSLLAVWTFMMIKDYRTWLTYRDAAEDVGWFL